MDRTITVKVTDEEAARIDARVAAGEFTSVDDFVHSAITVFEGELSAPLTDDLVRRLIAEDEAVGGPALDADEAFALVRRHIATVTAKRDAS